MVQRQAAEPAVLRVDAEVERRADRAPQVVAVGEPDRARAPGGAAGQDPAVERIEIVLPQQRQVGLGHRQVVVGLQHERRLRALELGLELSRRQRRVERIGDRSELHQRVEEDDVLGACRARQDDRGTAAHSPAPPAVAPPASPRPRAPRRSARRRRRSAPPGRGRSRRAARASCRGSSSSDVAGHRRDNPERADSPQGRSLRGRALRADRVATARASSRTSCTSARRGSPRSPSTGPRSATPFALRRSPSCATPSAGPATTSRWRRSSSPAPATEAFCSGRRPADPRRRRLHRRRPGRPAGRGPPRRRRPPRSDPPHPEAGGGDGRRMGGRRRAHPPPGLRPDDRGRQRPLRPDRATGRKLRRRLRRGPLGAQRRRQAGQGDLVPDAGSTTPGRRSRWGSSTRWSRWPSSSARRSPGVARCRASRRSPCDS